jgi:flagellin-like hook-associated protein FlgL
VYENSCVYFGLLLQMTHDRLKAEKKRLVSATRRVTRAKKMLDKANKALDGTRKRVLDAKLAKKGSI